MTLFLIELYFYYFSKNKRSLASFFFILEFQQKRVFEILSNKNTEKLIKLFQFQKQSLNN